MSKADSEGLVNKGIIEINSTPFSGKATVVVVGLTRSGTSMIASLYHALGLPMGESIDQAVFEDVEIVKLIEGGDQEQLKKAIAARNAKFPVWGFKRPNVYQQLDQLIPLLRKPRLVVLFRDILAIGLRNHVSMQMDVMKMLPKYVAQYAELVTNLEKVKCPALLVSYEKFLQFPKESVTRAASFAGIDLSPEQLKQAMNVVANGPELYLNASRLRYVGHVDRIVNGKLRGWAMVVGDPKVKAKVNLVCGGKVIATVVANKLRKDLVAAKVGDGYHGFELSVDPSIDANSSIDVTAGNTNVILANSGKTIASYAIQS